MKHKSDVTVHLCIAIIGSLFLGIGFGLINIGTGILVGLGAFFLFFANMGINAKLAIAQEKYYEDTMAELSKLKPSS